MINRLMLVNGKDGFNTDEYKKMLQKAFRSQGYDGDIPINAEHFVDSLERMVRKSMRKARKGMNPAFAQVHTFTNLKDNFFKTMYSCLTTANNLESGVSVELGKNENPSKTMRSVFTRMCHYTKIFHCSEYLRDMLILTDNEIHSRKLPFNSVFIDASFDYDGISFWGILLNALNIEDDKIRFVKDIKEQNAFHAIAFGMNDMDDTVLYTFTTVTETGYVHNAIENELQKFAKFIANFSSNFLDLLNDPSVAFVKASDGKYREFENLRRIYRSRRIDLDNTYFVKIKNPLKRYVDNYIHLRTKRGYSHRFWVRGHFRTLRADRYGENVGKKIWIAPFVKGQGILIEKQYDVDVEVSHRVE